MNKLICTPRFHIEVMTNIDDLYAIDDGMDLYVNAPNSAGFHVAKSDIENVIGVLQAYLDEVK
jgi:hypothetical protein